MSDSRWVDLHNHVIPGVDDGARDAAEAREAVAGLAGEGVRSIIATPHFDGSLTREAGELSRRLAELDAGWERLQEAVRGMDVELSRGVELRLDAPDVDVTDARLRLGGGPAILVEFPYFTVPPRSAEVLGGLRRQGYLPLLAHPERYHGLDSGLSVVASWLDAGAALQVNAASFRGRYGKEAQTVAQELVSRGWAHCIGSDYHARGEPRVAAARELLEGWGGEAQARLLFEENPSRLLAGEDCLPVAPLRPTGGFRRALRGMLPW